MGALHAGHAALLERAVAENPHTVLSIFVNPTQFGPNEDYSRYPRTLDADLTLARAAGVTEVFVPSVSDMYPNLAVNVQVFGVTDRWEGAHRKGHFDGVATVVCKLFNIVKPTRAYLGLKDLQQCQVIKLMTEGLNLPVDLRFCETVREHDGLAMSSRNSYLTPTERETAPMIFAELTAIKNSVMAGGNVPDLIQSSKAKLTAAGFILDYLAYVSLPEMNEITNHHLESAIIVAAKLGSTRLIDNVVLIEA